MEKQKLEIRKDGLFLGGERFYLASGSMHYFRVFPDGWEKRLRLMKDFGLTAVQTYVPWNLHEKKQGQYDFSGMLDLAAFLRLCAGIGLKVLLRPAPFICSEWDFGGMPWWLMKEKKGLRCMDPGFTGPVSDWYRALCPVFVPYLSTNGGPIIAVDLENEYGGYGNDHAYIAFLREELTKNGVDVPFYTTDGSNLQMLREGGLPDVWKGVNYRIESKEAIARLRKVQPDLPPFVGEYWSGFASYFGAPFGKRPVAPIARAYRDALEEGAYVNFYMFCGGTNFGFMNGARVTDTFFPTGEKKFRVITTSYDTEALIREDGEPTEKYYACRRELDAYLGRPVREERFAPSNSLQGEDVRFAGCAELLSRPEQFGECVESAAPLTFEQMDQGWGFVLYETMLPAGYPEGLPLSVLGLHDRAQVFLDGEYKGTLERDGEMEPILLATGDSPRKLQLLVENMGRCNTGWNLWDEKGILQEVHWGLPRLFHWRQWKLPLQSPVVPQIQESGRDGIPAFYRASFTAEEPLDTHLVPEGFTKGNIWVNGFNLGRYWNIGPQRSLYLPAGLLKKGENTLTVLDLYGGDAASKRVRFAQGPVWEITADHSPV